MRRLVITLLALTGLSGLTTVVALSVLPLPDRVTPSLSPLIYSAEGVLLRAYLNQEDKWRFPVTLTELPPLFVKGLLCVEDRRFLLHPGIDPFAMVRAAAQNLRAGKIVSGGSTITMQVVRLLAPRPRTLRSKLVEAWRAVQLEWHLSKADILRLYLTYAPYGSNVEGVSAASYLYFGHSAASLTPAEAAFLYLLPQAPWRWDTYTPAAWHAARQRVVRRLAGCNLLTPSEVEQARHAALPTVRRHFPLLAAHFADYVRQRHADRAQLTTTIAIDVQRVLERLVQRIEQPLAARGIHNIAVLVVENATRAVRGVIGNFDYRSTAHGQSIPAFAVPRSPGSTLKPFLYALAVDQGMILPETLLLDVPTRFAHYTPENFSGTHAGLVPAETALAQSLNVPFVRLLHELGVEHFLSFLEAGGLAIAAERRELGLSAIVGGIELSPLALAQLYVNLAHGGKSGALRLLAETQVGAEAPWLSPGAVWLTSRALASRDRPDFPQRQHITLAAPDMRWKTGTSQDRRDAWSVGYDDQYTVLVWLGNLDRTPSAALTGAESAAPLMFELLEALRARPRSQRFTAFPHAAGLTEVEVCAFSGQRASPYCPVTRTVWGVRHRLPTHTCRFHKQILRDVASGKRLLRGCDHGLQTELVHVLDLPPSVRRWLRLPLLEQPLMPPYHAQCHYVPVEDGVLSIRSPTHGAQYLLLASLGQRVLHLPLDLQGSGAAKDVSCLLNGRQFSLAQQGFRPVLHLERGRYHLFCSSMDGASDEVDFAVESATALPRLR
jgi:penicillin-binding protein 1C